MGRIVFLTNMERQYVMLERARDNLFRENRLKSEGRTVFLHDSVLWGGEWQNMFAASDIVIFKWMGNGLDTNFLKKASDFLQSNKITHVMLITDPGVEDLRYGITPEDRETLQKYLLYGGAENYRNLWFWLSSVYCRDGCAYQLPRPLVWNGIFHPKADKPFTNLSGKKRRKPICRTIFRNRRSNPLMIMCSACMPI